MRISITSGIQLRVGRRSNLFIGGSKQVPFGVPNPNTRKQPDGVGLFLSELRFESQVHKSHVRELIDHNHASSIDELLCHPQ